MNSRSIICGLVILLVMAITNAATAAEDEPDHIQTVCSVMEGNPIDPNIFVEYQGKKVFFCCNTCKAEFLKNPDKYVPKLPQFTETGAIASRPAEARPHEGHEHKPTGSFQYQTAKWIEPAGILTLVLLITTVCLGLLRRKSPRFLLKWHKRLGIVTLCAAVTHALLVFVSH